MDEAGSQAPQLDQLHADEAGDHVILEIGNDGLLATVQRGIADPAQPQVHKFDLPRRALDLDAARGRQRRQRPGPEH